LKNFADSLNTITHTQSIEYCWMHCKKAIREQFSRSERLIHGYVYEFMFKKACAD